MNQDRWLAVLAGELDRRGIAAEHAAPVVAEAATHLRESGEAPLRAFGPPEEYAAAVAEGLGPARWAEETRAPAGGIRLDARGIGKGYGRRRVLHNVDLTVRAGQVAAVVGANGCGKSTFLGICAGLVGADHGRVRVRGTIGYCPQYHGTVDFLRPDEHFVLVGAGRGLPRDRARAAGLAAAAELDWDGATRTQARHLSGGTRQKLNLVMAGLGEPDVLLLDEPYQGFDRGSYLDFWQQVWRWRDAGRAIVIVTHLLNQLDRVDTVLDLTPKEAVPC
ncbi:ATP-binding cassette domain-containing protein [Streptomyces hainanensis]|uniref:ATP-binding cassette domain-containing protein n=1 Tax=Streptomyces hainanensis TaxID=402648 RepID=A0A4V2Y3N8_9ACTN|nr:ATP-binding cassette domain-containing protein [Streptomyces hainanensis]TDC77195.1 ATP-binding cassette domain-containing protein [Streptomyces hainanensis]